MDKLSILPALELASLVRSKEVSPVEVSDAYIRRIEQCNSKLNAFVSIDFDRIRLEARRSEKAVTDGAELGPLHGVPLSIKSSIDVAGYRCEAGTRLRQGHIPDKDAPLVARLKAAGAIILGTTNVPELLMAYETDNLLYGRTNSPWDSERTPGGSSGGESAAIASFCSAGGVGSDGGGSIRVPAHFSGICGLKPTPGRIPATGHFPVSAGPFADLGVVGPMARHIGDLRVLFEVMAGPDNGDSNAAPVTIRPVKDLKKQRIGYFEQADGIPVTPETAAAVRSVASALSRDGFEVVPFKPAMLAKIRELWWALFGEAGAFVIGPMFAGREGDRSPILREFQDGVGRGAPLTLERFMGVLLERDVLRIEFLNAMNDLPLLLCPVCAIPAFKHREREWVVEGKTVRYLDTNSDVMAYSQWFNLLGNPAAVVPVARSANGLPIGIQIVGRPWEEEMVLALAQVVEQLAGRPVRDTEMEDLG